MHIYGNKMATIQIFLVHLLCNFLAFQLYNCTNYIYKISTIQIQFQLYNYIYKIFFDVSEFNDFLYKVIKCSLANTGAA